jgi:hypothetical protein
MVESAGMACPCAGMAVNAMPAAHAASNTDLLASEAINLKLS